MPLVQVHKARRRPEWQDTRPPEEELRAGYDIAAKHEAKWSGAYMALTRKLLTPAVLKRMRSALQRGDAKAAVSAIPGVKDPAWQDMSRKIKAAYSAVMTETGQAEYEREGIPLTFRVAKAKPSVPTVPVNPWSLKWIDKESARLIREVSQQTKVSIRKLIKRGYARGLRTEAILDQIKSRIGLLEAEELAVQRRMDLMLSREMPITRATAAAERYARQLHTKRAQRIGRTETITAQSKGRRHAWAEAKSKGELPEGVEREWAAVSISPRTCEICLELDGKRAKLGENYYSSVLGREVEGPGMSAHPL